MAGIRAVVTDLDGTFWHGAEEVHPATVEAAHELADRGIELLIATGRRLQSVRRGLAPHGLGRSAVLLSGCLGVELDSGEEWHRAGFPADLGTAVLAAFRRRGIEPVVYVGDGEVDAIADLHCSTGEGHAASFGDALLRRAPDEWAERGVVVAFGVIGGADGDALQAVAGDLDGLANCWFQEDPVYGGWTLMVSPAEITKVTGVAPWCEARGYAPDEVLAVGDENNDFALLEWAGVAVAVEGSAAARRPHDARIARPDAGGWATLLDLL